MAVESTMNKLGIKAPDFDLPDYKNIPVELPDTEVSPAEIDAALERLRGQTADFIDVPNRGLEMEDFAVRRDRIDQPARPVIGVGAEDAASIGEAVERAGAVHGQAAERQRPVCAVLFHAEGVQHSFAPAAAVRGQRNATLERADLGYRPPVWVAWVGAIAAVTAVK